MNNNNNQLTEKLQLFYLITQIRNIIDENKNKEEIIKNINKYDLNDIKKMKKVAIELKEKINEIKNRNK